MKLLVCGSRIWPEAWMWWVDARMIEIHAREYVEGEGVPGGFEVMVGDAPGVDRRAGACASRNGWLTRIFQADWRTHGKAAGPIRNQQMADERPDLALAFHYGDTPGTADMIKRLRKAKIPTEIYLKPPPPNHAALDAEDD